MHILPRSLVLSLLILPMAQADSVHQPQEDFWQALSALCGQAFAGRLASYDESLDQGWLDQQLVMHVRKCSADEIHIPLHVGEDRSRTWVLRRDAQGIELKHDHRLESGAEDEMTWYGGRTSDAGRAWRQVFPVDDYSRVLFVTAGLEGSLTNIWYMDIRPGEHFAYGLTRVGRHLRVQFELDQSVEPPPPAWGHE
ncbi:MAG: hypothetical protein EA418_07275 [Wenzhouxiangellaceae bacterium]|nr:MAG: hypothetical protein EA418_07275 [Wenzhouxiangellaceae bacterium]